MNEAPLISSPHLHQGTSVAGVMRRVIMALVPGILLSTWVYGWGVLLHCVLAVLCALVFEAVMLRLREQPLSLFLFDGSAVVTALLFALAITPYAPWWVDIIGMAFAIIVAKHLYGGLGYNLFNPAMTGYVFVLLCFPAALTVWPYAAGMDHAHAGLLDTLFIIGTGHPYAGTVDSLSGATPLSYMKSQLNGMAMVQEITTAPLFGTIAGKGAEWLALAWVAGGTVLLLQRIINWHMPVVFSATLFVLSLLSYWLDASRYPSPFFTLFAGGAALAAFFIITDPVTAANTPRGQIIYAAGIGVITWLIRTWGGYPEGVAFAVLIMNAAAPVIDASTRPRVFGEH